MRYAHPLDAHRPNAGMATSTLTLIALSLIEVEFADVREQDRASYTQARDLLSRELSIRNAPTLPPCANCERAVEEHDEDTGTCPVGEVVMGRWDQLQ